MTAGTEGLLRGLAPPGPPPPRPYPLALRAVAGLTTREIAAAFLVPEATMAQRISRAKARIKASDEPFRLPSPPERDARLRLVLHVLYLLFNERYAIWQGRVTLGRAAQAGLHVL